LKVRFGQSVVQRSTQAKRGASGQHAQTIHPRAEESMKAAHCSCLKGALVQQSKAGLLVYMQSLEKR